MSAYVWKAMDLTGAKATGEVDAETKQAVADQLKARGLIVLDISDKHSSKEINLSFLKRIKPTDLTIMTRQLSTMVSSGMTILRALYVLEAQTENEQLVEVITSVRKDVEAGLALSDALERHPKIFSPLFVAMTRAGETGGMLEASLLRVADQLEKEDSLRRQVKSAMTYPIVVLSFAFVHPDRARHVPRAGVRRRLQAVRRRPAVHHEDHRDDVGDRDRLLVGRDHRRRPPSSGPSASGSRARRAAGSGTRSACGSRPRSATSSRRSRSPAGRARCPRSSAPACR